MLKVLDGIKRRLNNWVSNNVFRASFELSTKERKELAEFYEKTKTRMGMYKRSRAAD